MTDHETTQASPTTYKPSTTVPTYEPRPQELRLPRRVWELPLAILLWTYIVLGVVFFLLLLVGGIGAISV